MMGADLERLLQAVSSLKILLEDKSGYGCFTYWELLHKRMEEVRSLINEVYK
jgi:hypothetical protein